MGNTSPTFELALSRLKLGLLCCWLMASFTGCPQSDPCGAGSCAGCCDSTGECVTGNSVSACGSSGNTCATCGLGKVCDPVVSVCINPVSMGTGGGTGSGGGQGGGSGGAGGGIITQDCSGLMKSQAVSAPCCLAFGVDACGANLFCAAFDGRTQPTCYLERSRADNATCLDDGHCVSGSCKMPEGRCRATLGNMCMPELGCATVASGAHVVCAKLLGVMRCAVTQGTDGEPCEGNTDCASKICTDYQCACTPKCAGKVCGDDSCGGSCGSCGAGSCYFGQCSCLSGNTFCPSEGCIDTRFSARNCGACGNDCPALTRQPAAFCARSIPSVRFANTGCGVKTTQRDGSCAALCGSLPCTSQIALYGISENFTGTLGCSVVPDQDITTANLGQQGFRSKICICD